jgi:Leucine Rich repeat
MNTKISLKSKSNYEVNEMLRYHRGPNVILSDINHTSVDDLIVILRGIPNHIKSIELFNGIFEQPMSMLSKITMTDFSRLIQCIPFHVRILRLPFHSLNDCHAIIIAKIGKFETVHLAGNEISDKGVVHLANNKHLQKVGLNWNIRITDVGGKALVANDNIKVHDGLIKCGLSDKNGQLIRDAISEQNPIKRERLRRELGMKPSLPSLKRTTGLFIKDNEEKYDLSELPNDVKDLVHTDNKYN